MTDFILSGTITGAKAPESAVIFFHGFGSNGADFAGLSPYLEHAFPKTAFYFPDAPDPVPAMPFFNAYQWFPLEHLMSDVASGRNTDEIFSEMLPDALKCAAVTRRYVDRVRQKHALPASKTVIAGFSQGGLMALLTAVTDTQPAAGVIGMSACGLALKDGVFSCADCVSKPPAMLIHGTADGVVPFETAAYNQRNLRACGISADVFAVDGMDHGIDARALQKMLEALGKFI